MMCRFYAGKMSNGLGKLAIDININAKGAKGATQYFL